MNRKMLSLAAGVLASTCLAQNPPSNAAPQNVPQPPATLPAIAPTEPKPIPPIRPEVIQSLARLREEREAFLRERAEFRQELASLSQTNVDRNQIRTQVESMMNQLATRPPTPAAPPPAPAPAHNETTHGDATASTPIHPPADPVSLGRVLYASKNYDGALRSLRMADMEVLDKQDRAFSRYLTGTCLRMLGKKPEAAAAYREVADAKEDEFMSECALWQIQSIRWQQEVQSQLEDSAKRRESK